MVAFPERGDGHLSVGGSPHLTDEARDAGQDWSPAERALLDSALDFYGAAESVIDFGADERPQLRRDASGLKAVRDAMSELEQRIRVAHADGVAPERIAGITRLDDEIVALILARSSGAGEA